MPRLLAPLVVLGLLLGACSAEADPAAPAPRPPRVTATAAPYHLDRLDALTAVGSLRPGGFERVLTCATRQRDRCQREDTEQTRWLVGTQAHGAGLTDGNGMVEFVRMIVTAWPSAARASTYARRLTEQLKQYRGEYDLAMVETGPDTYRPGDRGRGELQRISMLRWRGVGLRRVFHYVFYRSSPAGRVVGPPSATVLGGRFVLRRGRYVLDLEWQARNRPTDRRLSHLPRRLLRALG